MWKLQTPGEFRIRLRIEHVYFQQLFADICVYFIIERANKAEVNSHTFTISTDFSPPAMTSTPSMFLACQVEFLNILVMLGAVSANATDIDETQARRSIFE